jgi:predicted GNAT superfamily acetyltransferase
MSQIQIACSTPADDVEFLALNEASVPHVNSISPEKLKSLREQSVFTGVARDAAGRFAGFLLVLDQDAEYESLNFQWFKARYERFVYVDRVAVGERFRRAGVGRQLYAALEPVVAGCFPWLACEVNLSPPNPASLAFHHGLGFAEVGQQDTENGAKRVSLMTRPLAV